MIEIKENLIETMLDKAIRNIKTRNGVQLVSITKKIDATDPVQFFEAAKKIKKNRIFWSSTAEDFYIVGIGSACSITAEKSRFEATEDQWSQLLDEALIHNPHQVPGTGILALGGMSFDPRKTKSDLWKKYKPSQFTIPEFTLTKNKDNYYFTIITQVTKEDDPTILARELGMKEYRLLTGKTVFPAGANVIAKHEIQPDKWMNSVDEAIKAINNKQANKIVLAREVRLKLSKQVEIGVMLKKLIQMQSNSYVFAFEQGEDCFIGATPERLVKVEGKQLLSTCLAGTAPRGKTIEEDTEISHTLLHDEKNLEEHEYVVKMIRNAIENYCVDIVIPSKPIIYPLKNLQHLYTPVTATLKNGYSIFDIIKQLHPTPALGGVPREESLTFIREHEALDRGWYGAPIGWLDSNQNGEFAVAIRSGLIQGDEVSLFAGCGVMKESDPKAEYEETNIKFLPMLSALEAQNESY